MLDRVAYRLAQLTDLPVFSLANPPVLVSSQQRRLQKRHPGELHALPSRSRCFRYLR